MFLRLTTSALALAFGTASGALALTPEEVWTGWTSQYAAMGYTITEGARDAAGETLTLRDVVLTHAAEEGRFVMTLPQVVLTTAGDGSVRTTFADAMPIRLQDDEGGTVEMTLTAPGLEVTSNGEGAARTDRATAPEATIAVNRVDRPGDKPDLTDPGSVTLTDLASETVTQDGRTYDSTVKLGKLAYRIDVTEVEGSFKGQGSLNAVEGSGSATLPATGAAPMSEDMAAALKAGAQFKGTLKTGAGDLTFDYADQGDKAEDGAPAAPGSTGQGSLKMAGTDLTVGLSQAGVTYQGAVTGLDTAMTDSQLPAPVAYQLARGAFSLAFPVTAGEAPAPFTMTYNLDDLTLAESVWNLFDPDKKLPRDPADLAIEVSGLAKVTRDLLDPATAQARDEGEAAEPAAPGTDAATPGATPDAATPDTAAAEGAEEPAFQPTEVTIKRFALDALGAKLTADGSLKASGTGTMSEPVGTIHARFEGSNTLIEALRSVGVISDDYVSGIRMMLAMVAKPGEGDDVLTSDIEFRGGGSVFANGQQIK